MPHEIRGVDVEKYAWLCQETSPKRWFVNMEMTSNCDVTNSEHQIQMTTIRPWTKTPPMKIFCARHCSLSISFLRTKRLAWYTAARQLFTRWMWTDASRLNQSKFTYVNAVIIKAVECNVFKKTNFFCDVIKGRSSSTCGPRKISTSFPGNLHFFKPWLWHYQERDLHSHHSLFKTQMMQMPWTTFTGTNIILNFLEKNTTVRASLKTQIGSCDANAQQHQVEVTYPSE